MKKLKALPVPPLVREAAVMLWANIVLAVAVFFFLMPSHASVSSIAGAAIVIANFVPLQISAITLILNVVLLVIGWFTCGKEFALKTAVACIVLPMLLAVLERCFPNFTSLTGSAELDVLCYILVVSYGLSILFNRNAASGGLDIVAMILHKYLHMDLGKAMSLSGMCIALSSALAYDSKTVVLSVVGTYFNGIVLDRFIFGQNLKRRVCIISREEQKVRDFILQELHSGATEYESVGAFTRAVQRELITIVNNSEYQKLMSFLSKTDPNAFVTVYTVSDIRYRPKPPLR